MSREIIIIDQTLRDGEQQALVNFSQSQKVDLANLSNEIGADYIDLMPISNHAEWETVNTAINLPLLLSTPLDQKAIEVSLGLKKDLVLFQAVSDILLPIRYKKDIKAARKENIEIFKDKIKYLRKTAGDKIKIFVAGEDSSRANFEYLVEFLKSIEKFADGYIISDSVGYLIPEKTKELTESLIKKTKLRIGIHAHNDLGLADRNTIAAVLAGADIVSGTFTGIGERAGNANLGNILRTLKSEYSFDFPQINFEKISEMENLVYRYCGKCPAAPFSRESFYIESGIHVHAILNSPSAYSIIDPKLLGYEHTVFFGKKSGISNFKYYFKKKFTDEQLKSFRDIIKDESIKHNRSYALDEVKNILHLKNFN